MSLLEVGRIVRTIHRRWTNPRDNPMSMWQMTWLYLKKKTYLYFHQLPAIQIPFTSDEKIAPGIRLAVIVHCFYPELIEEILEHIEQIPCAYRLYVSTDTESKKHEILAQIGKKGIEGADVRLAPNIGRDIGPKYITFRDVYEQSDYFLHLHSKKSPHTGSWGKAWREYLLRILVGSPEIICSNLRLLADPRIGLVFPVPLNDTLPALRWGGNFSISSELARRLGFDLEPEYCADYPDGSMYWGKSAALKPLLDLGLKFEDFSAEANLLDGSLAHAVERMVIYSAHKQGLNGCRVELRSDSAPSPRGATPSLTEDISSVLNAQKREQRDARRY